jgi:hypothetical protein
MAKMDAAARPAAVAPSGGFAGLISAVRSIVQYANENNDEIPYYFVRLESLKQNFSLDSIPAAYLH